MPKSQTTIGIPSNINGTEKPFLAAAAAFAYSFLGNSLSHTPQGLVSNINKI